MTGRSVRASDVIRRLRWVARLSWEEVAWPEFLAIAAIGLAIGLEFWVNKPLRQELRELHGRAAIASTDSVVGAEASSLPLRGGTGFVAGFMAFLPVTGMREQQMQTLHSLASESTVVLSRVEYGHSRLEHLPGQRMTMELSMSAEYAPYRKFLHDLLVAIPNLSIDRVTMEKAPGQATRLNIRVETSLYYQDAYRNMDVGSVR